VVPVAGHLHAAAEPGPDPPDLIAARRGSYNPYLSLCITMEVRVIIYNTNPAALRQGPSGPTGRKSTFSGRTPRGNSTRSAARRLDRLAQRVECGLGQRRGLQPAAATGMAPVPRHGSGVLELGDLGPHLDFHHADPRGQQLLCERLRLLVVGSSNCHFRK
jgi:hypothetical protein